MVGNVSQTSSTNAAVQNTGAITLAAGNMANGASAAVSAMGAGSFVSFRGREVTLARSNQSVSDGKQEN